MRAVIQRVSHATVSVEGKELARMGRGLLALVAVAPEDTGEEAKALVARLLRLRVFPDERERMNRSLLDCQGALGIVSQFTLFADMRKGNRPYFGAAASPDHAEPLFAEMVQVARDAGVEVISGCFGAMMEVSLTNEGPVTLWIDTQELAVKRSQSAH